MKFPQKTQGVSFPIPFRDPLSASLTMSYHRKLGVRKSASSPVPAPLEHEQFKICFSPGPRPQWYCPMRIQTPATFTSRDAGKGLITWHAPKRSKNDEGLAVDGSLSLTVEWDRQLSPEETVDFLQLWIKGLFPVKRGKEASYGLKKQICSKWQTLVLPTSKNISAHL